MEHKKHNFDELFELSGTDSKKHFVEKGDDPAVLPMWIADTDFRCPAEITEAMVTRAQQGTFGYPIELSEFSNAVAHWLASRFDCTIYPGWVEYISGVLPGMVYAIRAFSQPGDKILMHSPTYLQLQEITRNNGRRVEMNHLILKDGRYEIDFDTFEKAVKDPRVTLLLLCNPHNPTGRVFTTGELERMATLCADNDVFILSDEIHCDMPYPGHQHIPLLNLSEKAAQNCAVFINPSKTFNTPGLRAGAAIIPNPDYMRRYRVSVVNNKAAGRNVFGQLALIAAYEQCSYYVDQMVDYLDENRKLIENYFTQNIPKIRVIHPEATYLLWLDCRELNLEQAELNRFFIDRAKVKLNNGAGFGPMGTGFMRINIACPRARLQQGLERIKDAVNTL